MASYNNFKNNAFRYYCIFNLFSVLSQMWLTLTFSNKSNMSISRDSFLIPIINCATSFYAGFAIFSVLGFMAKAKGVEVEGVAQSG